MPSELDDLYSPILPFSAWAASSAAFARFDGALSEFVRSKAASSPETVAAAVSAVFDAAALETGAIEGLYASNEGVTLSVVEGVITLAEAIAESPGFTVERLVGGQRSAYDIARDVVDDALPISEVLIRQIHEQACAGQDTYWVTTASGRQEQSLPKGTHKQHPNHVLLADGTTHAYAPVEQVGPELHRLISELRSAEFESASPVLRSAYIHHALTHIHPFADGNGRTARVVGSLPLVAATGLPLIVFADRLPDYWRGQALADVGEVAAFLDFIELAMVDLLQIVTLRISTSIGVDADLHDAVSRRRLQAVAHGELSDRLATIVKRELRQQAAETTPDGVHLNITASGPPTAPPPFETTRDGWRVALQASVGITYEVWSAIGVVISKDLDHDGLLGVASSGGAILTVRLDELWPRPTQALEAKVRAWARAEVSLLKQRLTQALEE